MHRKTRLVMYHPHCTAYLSSATSLALPLLYSVRKDNTKHLPEDRGLSQTGATFTTLSTGVMDLKHMRSDYMQRVCLPK
jgi:hypothetical protein